jgi:hypothetical protein
MPVPDLGPRRTSEERLRIARDKAFVRQMNERLRRGRKRPDDESGESVPVTPDRPLDLSGGAAAALAFDD